MYNFGEKETELSLPVWQSPKYQEAKAKAIELIESEKYKDVLKPSDFWILMNKTKNGDKMIYSGLIISHDGCLKINDSLDNDLKFKPESVSLDKDGYNGSLVYSYCNEKQGLYEVGEVSNVNCKNGYPYAMAFKRCFDRVVLKNSKIAYNGIYSESESDEFVRSQEVAKPQNNDAGKSTENNKANTSKEEKKTEMPKNTAKKAGPKITPKQKEIIENYCGAKLADWLVKHNMSSLDEMSLVQAKEIIQKINEAKESKNGQQSN